MCIEHLEGMWTNNLKYIPTVTLSLRSYEEQTFKQFNLSHETHINTVLIKDRVLLEHSVRNFSFNSEDKIRIIFYFKETNIF